MSGIDVPQLISLVNRLQITKYLVASCGALIFYDYLLTFENEGRLTILIVHIIYSIFLAGVT
jgi:hypothetical protein